MNNIDNIFIEGTAKTPKVDFNQLTGELILSGRSYPEDAAKVYEPLLMWIQDYIKFPSNATNFHIKLEYYNSASLIWISKMFRKLSKIQVADSVLFLHLYFDIQDFNNMKTDEISDIVSSIVGNIKALKISVGIKIHGTDLTGKIVKDSIIFI
jgi:hypothetical protein